MPTPQTVTFYHQPFTLIPPLNFYTFYLRRMTGIDDVQLLQVMVHNVGNQSRGEELRLSTEPLLIEEDITTRLLTRYFLGSFNENELYRFTHLSDLALNEVYTYVSAIFEDRDSLPEQSRKLAEFLYSKSTHVKVKDGEFYVAFFQNIPFEGEAVNAIGLFKSENKETFLKLLLNGDDRQMINEDGININKLDKGCLIFHTHTHDGYKVCVADSTNKGQEAQYWVTDFLQVTPWADSYHQTDKYLSLCKNFITSEYPEKFEVSKTDQADLLNRSIDYFKKHEQFSLQEFTQEVMHHPEVVDAFMDHKRNFEASRHFEIEDEFAIHVAAVKKQQKVFKSIVKLDRNFHIYIHGRRDLIEKGVDELGRKYYKIYYEEEQ